MAGKIDKEMEEHLKCPVCHGMIEDPRFLACGHSYCKDCIEAVIKLKLGMGQSQMECPYCRQIVAIKGPSGGSLTLSKNWIANNILQALGNYEKTQSERVKNACKTHPKNEKNYYCEQCGVLACCECAIRDHFNHGERPKTLDEVTEDIKTKTGRMLERANEWSAHHAAYVDAIKEIKQEGMQALECVERDVLQEYDARLLQLTHAKDRLLANLNSWKQPFFEIIDELLLAETEVTTRVNQSCAMAKCRVDTGVITDIVDSYKEWADRLQTDLTYEVPETDSVEEDLNAVKALRFEKTPVTPSEIMDIGFIGHHTEAKSASENTDGSTCTRAENSDNEPEDNLNSGFLENGDDMIGEVEVELVELSDASQDETVEKLLSNRHVDVGVQTETCDCQILQQNGDALIQEKDLPNLENHPLDLDEHSSDESEEDEASVYDFALEEFAMQEAENEKVVEEKEEEKKTDEEKEEEEEKQDEKKDEVMVKQDENYEATEHEDISVPDKGQNLAAHVSSLGSSSGKKKSRLN